MSDNEILEAIEVALQPYLSERLHQVVLTESTILCAELGLHSSHLVDIIMDLEDRLKLVPGDTYSPKTVGDLATYIKNQKPASH